jgi:hypothetical protein
LGDPCKKGKCIYNAVEELSLVVALYQMRSSFIICSTILDLLSLEWHIGFKEELDHNKAQTDLSIISKFKSYLQ